MLLIFLTSIGEILFLWFGVQISYFISYFRTGKHNDPSIALYKFVDKTGILDTHREWLAGRQVDMKIMYYELIRMITGHERGMCEESECYDIARSVGKIEGYQELTNKMQRVFNQRLNLDIDEICSSICINWNCDVVRNGKNVI